MHNVYIVGLLTYKLPRFHVSFWLRSSPDVRSQGGCPVRTRGEGVL